MKTVFSPSALCILAGALLATAFTATGAEAAGRRAVWLNPAGGVTATHLRAARGPYGGYAARAGANSFNPDGSASHASSFAAAGLRGSVQSNGSATRDAAGQVTQNRSTVATSAITGNSIQRSTSYNSDTGRTRSATCYNPAGAVIACR